MTTLAVVGAQWGSEGKGAVVHHLADRFQVHVRVGGPNAGHTFYHEGEKHVMRAVPCGWTNPAATLVIGRGATINPRVLKEEVEWIAQRDPTIWDRLFVDGGAWCITPDDLEMEATSGLGPDIGSTLEGVGRARIKRLCRVSKIDCRFETEAHNWGLQGLVHMDTPMLLNWHHGNRNILLEGTQGFGLSLYHGAWPYVTSHDTTAAQLAADCGLPPNAVDDVLLVMRTFPIRVGGNSGPLPREVTWDGLSQRLGRPVEEYTTVTGRRRRVAMWDDEIIQQAVYVNGERKAAMMFCDYLHPGQQGLLELKGPVEDWIETQERRHGIDVILAGTGPETIVERRELPW